MEKFLKPYDKECMRLAMLKHEETFKQQVYELHRLYRIQKIMMSNIQSNRPNARSQELWSSKDGFNFNQQNSVMKMDLERAAGDEYVVQSHGDHHRVVELIDESEIELTLGPTSYNRRKKAETPLTSDSGPSFSSSSTGSSQINRTSPLTDQTRGARTRELVQVPDMSLGYGNGSKNNISFEEQLRQESLKQPPWLFQVLSLNTT